MDEKLLNEEFIRLKELIKGKYNKKDDLVEEILKKLVYTYLDQVLLDVNNMSFVDFYKKYLNGMVAFEASDFTTTEITNIIAETPLTERDRNMAKLYYIELRSEEDIARILDIDKKTVHSNIPKISTKLKTTSVKLYSDN